MLHPDSSLTYTELWPVLLNLYPPFPGILQNRKGQVPAEVVPDPMDMSLDKAEAALVAKELRTLLEEAVPLSCALPKVTLPNYDNVPGNLMLSALGLRLGDRVLLDGQKVRVLGVCVCMHKGKGVRPRLLLPPEFLKTYLFFHWKDRLRKERERSLFCMFIPPCNGWS